MLCDDSVSLVLVVERNRLRGALLRKPFAAYCVDDLAKAVSQNASDNNGGFVSVFADRTCRIDGIHNAG